MVGILYLNSLRKYVLSFNTKLALGVLFVFQQNLQTTSICWHLNVTKKTSSTPMKFNFRSQRLLKDPGELRAGSHLHPTTNGKVQSPKEGTTLILLLFHHFHAMPAKHLNHSHIHCLPLAGLTALSLLLSEGSTPISKLLLLQLLSDLSVITDICFFVFAFWQDFISGCILKIKIHLLNTVHDYTFILQDYHIPSIAPLLPDTENHQGICELIFSII